MIHPPRLSFLMTVSYWLDHNADKRHEEFDVAIVGGGIVGACCAYWLSKRTGLKTVLIEANKKASGASGRSGGFVLRGIVAHYAQAVEAYGREKARWIFQFNEQTQSYLAAFAERYGEWFDFDRCGSYLLASSIEELHLLEKSAQLMRDDGFDVEYLKHDPIKRNYYGALVNACDIAVHSGKLVDALLETSGVKVVEGESVFRMEALPDGRVELETPNLRVRCGRALVVTNAYAPLMDTWFVGKVRTVRGQALVTRPIKKRVLENLCYANYGYEWFRQLADGRLLIGGCREPFAADEVGYADMVTVPVQTALHNYIKDRFPEFAGVGIDYRWSGIMAFTRDGLPLVGEVLHQPVVAGSAQREMPGVFFAIGCNGHGLGWSFALAKLLTEVALDGTDPGMFAASRLLAKPERATKEVLIP
jgi:glycine/D-amino acid oxidase-like deaminating enzyme